MLVEVLAGVHRRRADSAGAELLFRVHPAEQTRPVTAYFEEPFHKEKIMQQRVERWLSYWVAKPTSWAIFGIWLAVKYGWFGIAWYLNRLREKWTKRETNGKPAVLAELPIAVPTRRANKREVARKE
jgi:hypothetical protein